MKFVLSAYFIFEQMLNKRLDKRYLVWLISLLDRRQFPENVKIISWNYDFQIQLTAQTYMKESFSVANTGTSKHSPALIDYYPKVGLDMTLEIGRISLLHLNGLAGMFKHSHYDHNVFLDEAGNIDGKYIDTLANSNEYNRINFAWEDHFKFQPIKILTEMVKDVTIMVVIGYSFPFFNRRIDKQVFAALQEPGKLNKIYFQDPIRDGAFLKSQFGLPNNIQIEHIPETEAFFIPYEL